MKNTIGTLIRSGWVLFLAALLFQCNKTENPSVQEQLIGSWMITGDSYTPGYDYDFDGTDETDAFAEYEACDKDDLIVFKSNGQGDYNMGTTKCDPSEPQTVPFFWGLKDNNTIITIDGLIDYNIETLTDNQLVVRWVFNEDGTQYTERVTFVRK
jgi:hypothetical protein